MGDEKESSSTDGPQRSGWLHDLLRSLGLRSPGEEAGGEEARPAAAPQARAMIRNLLRIGELRVGDVMVPRADIVGLDATDTLPEAVAVFRECGHSRLPVYRDSLDDVIGMVHVKDLLGHWSGEKSFSVPLIARPVLFVPPSMHVLDLLKEMQTTRQHMALVIDEYGGVDGLVTIEDLVEQIVGDIEDEYDEDEPPNLIERPDGTIDTAGRTTVEELEARLGLGLLNEEFEDEVDTVGGLVVALAGRVPRRGEVIQHPAGVEFEVTDAKSRRVDRVRVRLPRAAA